MTVLEGQTDKPISRARSATSLQRARGEAYAAFFFDGERTRLRDLRQSGCGKIRFPKSDSDVPVAVFLNTSGGVTGGDRLDYGVLWNTGSAAVATSQAAERIYRRRGGTGRIATRLTLCDGANGAWLPQETILFDRSSMTRTTEVDLASTATLIAAETIVLGRTAMGETVRTADVTDSWRIRRSGQLVFADTFKVSGDVMAILSSSATGNRCSAFSTVIYASSDASVRLAAARDLLNDSDCEAAASALNDVLIVRMLAPSATVLRHSLTRFLEEFRCAPLPRVWYC